MRTRLILIRHGQTPENVRGVIHADKSGALLNENGRNQMNLTANKLKEDGVDVIYSSTEKRAEESAQIISELCNVPYKPIDMLKERRWGKFDGKSWEDIRKILKPMSLNERYNYTPPDGESWRSAEERLRNVVVNVLQKHPGEVIAFVTHAGSIRMLMPFLLGAPIEETFKYLPDNASLTIFDYDDGAFKKVIINDTSHLE